MTGHLDGGRGDATAPTHVGSDDDPPSDITGDVLPASPAGLRRGATVGRYVVLDTLGAGGMGVVYAAYDPELDRKVALKLLAADRHDPQRRARLLREAQALARLAHPNVVAVHDAGDVGEQVFVAMELVDGATLVDALAGRRHAWPEVLEIFLAVGRGLAAAHAAGLVHRDLKPANIMIGRDGRARVMDFGLARVEHPAPALHDSLAQPRAAALDLAVTRAGARLGTPRYMAPEQWLGRPGDARTDQFGYCVAFWEALYGERPFRGETPAQLMATVLRGEIAEPTARDGAPPRWLRAVLRRGLAPDPDARFPDMPALLAALQRRQRTAALRRGALAALGALAVAIVAGLAWWPRSSPPPCVGLEARLDGVWDEPRRAAGRDAFLATGKPHAAAAWERVAAALDAWSSQWVGLARDACLATRVHGIQSEQLLDRRTACLGRRLDEARGLVDLLARADAEVVANAARAVDRLTPLAACTDAEALLADVPPPAPGLAARVAAVRSALDRAKPLADALALADAEAAVRPLVAEADAIGYDPLRAEVRRALALVLRSATRFADAEGLLHEALAAAEAGRDAAQATLARKALVSVLIGLSRLDEARLVARLVEPELDRPGRERERADLESERGRLLLARGDLPSARAALVRALALQERLHGPDGAPVAGALDFLSYVELLEGRVDDSLAHARRGVALLERHLGAAHPRLLSPLTALGDALTGAGRLDEARATYERALALATTGLGPEHPEVGHCHWSLGDIAAQRRDRTAAARHYDAALAVTERALGLDHPDTAECLFRVAVARAWAGRADEAERLLARVLEIHGRHSGPDSYLTLRARGERAVRLAELARHDEAIAELSAVAAATERTQGETDELVTALLKLGDVSLRAGRPADAIAPLARADALAARQDARPERRADVEFQLAQALWDGGGDRTRARALATSARARWLALGPDAAQAVAPVDAWLSDHVPQDNSAGR